MPGVDRKYERVRKTTNIKYKGFQPPGEHGKVGGGNWGRPSKHTPVYPQGPKARLLIIVEWDYVDHIYNKTTLDASGLWPSLGRSGK